VSAGQSKETEGRNCRFKGMTGRPTTSLCPLHLSEATHSRQHRLRHYVPMENDHHVGPMSRSLHSSMNSIDQCPEWRNTAATACSQGSTSSASKSPSPTPRRPLTLSTHCTKRCEFALFSCLICFEAVGLTLVQSRTSTEQQDTILQVE
jgi:hypothetical protein